MCLRPISRYVDLEAFALALIAILLSNSSRCKRLQLACPTCSVPLYPPRLLAVPSALPAQTDAPSTCICKHFLSFLVGILRYRKWKRCHFSDQMYSARVDPYPEVIHRLIIIRVLCRGLKMTIFILHFVFEIPLILFLSRLLSFGEGISERISDTAGISL